MLSSLQRVIKYLQGAKYFVTHFIDRISFNYQSIVVSKHLNMVCNLPKLIYFESDEAVITTQVCLILELNLNIPSENTFVHKFL